MNTNHEQELDTAIGTALGVEDAPVSSREDRAMRETVARLAAASPHMKPSPELRARILQATATRTFKMEDYRKTSGEDYRWYKWGFYAAAAFLVMAGVYNMNVDGKL